MAQQSTSPPRRHSSVSPLPVRVPTIDTTVQHHAAANNEGFLAPGSYGPRRGESPVQSFHSSIGTHSAGSETLASKLPRSQTDLGAAAGTSPRAQERYALPPRSHTLGASPVSPTLASTGRSSGIFPRSSRDSISSIDPLSQHIFRRTNTKGSHRRLKPVSSHTQSNEAGTSRLSRPKPPKEKRKSTSFLSRLLRHNKKEQSFADIHSEDDVASDTGRPGSATAQPNESRPQGVDAEVFAQPINGYAYVPKYPPPPKYIKVRSHLRKQKDFDRLFIAQELQTSGPTNGLSRTEGSLPQTRGPDVTGRKSFQQQQQEREQQQRERDQQRQQERPVSTGKAVWAVEFSRNGRFLAAAGQDHIVRVWSVISSAQDRQAHEIEEDARNDQMPIRLNAPVFKTQPVQVYEGHTGSVVDLSWSKNDFLLSTSMDKTVRLWHVTRKECLCCFMHQDFVTSIQFHPKDDRFFLAGSLDSKLRLWSIPDKSVAFEAATPDMITSVAFTPDGKHAIAGLLNGLCIIYDTDGLKVLSQIRAGGHHHLSPAYASHRRRRNSSKGSKITGIDSIMLPPDHSCAATGQLKLLITSNDSRIRLYNFKDRTLEAKIRGLENNASQIKASFSSDGRYIICGSESRKTYIWPLHALGVLYNANSMNSPGSDSRFNSNKGKEAEFRSFEVFEAHDAPVISAVFAPVRTKQVLDASDDLLYSICNPPPVRLAGADGGNTSAPKPLRRNRTNSFANSITPSAHGSLMSPMFTTNKNVEDEVPGYMAPSSHPDGNIIVTADTQGSIKVFRQDCGYWKRPALDVAASAVVGNATPAAGTRAGGVAGPIDVNALAASNAPHRTALSRLSLLRHNSATSRRSISASALSSSRPLSRELQQPRTRRNSDAEKQNNAHGPIGRIQKEDGIPKRGDTVKSTTPSERILHWRSGVLQHPNASADSVAHTQNPSLASWTGGERTRSPSPVPSGSSKASLGVFRPGGHGHSILGEPGSKRRSLWNTLNGAKSRSRPVSVSGDASGIVTPSAVESSRTSITRGRSVPASQRTSVDVPAQGPIVEITSTSSAGGRDRDDDSVTSAISRRSSVMGDREVFLSPPESPVMAAADEGLKPRSSSTIGFVTTGASTPLSPPSTTDERDTIRERDSSSVVRNEEEGEVNGGGAEGERAKGNEEEEQKPDAAGSGGGGGGVISAGVGGLAANAFYWTRMAAQALTSGRRTSAKPALVPPKVTVSNTDGTNTPISGGSSPAHSRSPSPGSDARRASAFEQEENRVHRASTSTGSGDSASSSAQRLREMERYRTMTTTTTTGSSRSKLTSELDSSSLGSEVDPRERARQRQRHGAERYRRGQREGREMNMDGEDVRRFGGRAVAEVGVGGGGDLSESYYDEDEEEEEMRGRGRSESSVDGDSNSYDEGSNEEGDDGDGGQELRCTTCGNLGFRATMKGRKLICTCTQCGRAMT